MTPTGDGPTVATQWPVVPIKRFARLGSGHTPSRQHPEYWEHCTIPWLTLADVWQLRDGTRTIIEETAELISELGIANSAAELHPAGTVVLSRTASVGFSCILGSDMATSQDFATWTCGPMLMPKYLLYALRGQPHEIERRKTGSTHKTIYMPDIETMRVPLPPLLHQAAIVDFLDHETSQLDALIAAKVRMASLLEEYYQAHHDGYFQVLDVPQAALGRFALDFTQGVSPQAENRPAEAGEWGLLKLSAVKQGRFAPAENKALPHEFEIDPAVVPRPGDLLVTRSNTPRYVGDACAVTVDPGQVILSDLIYRVRLDQRLTPEFAAAALLRTEARNHLSATARGTSQSMVKLRGEDVKATMVPVAHTQVQLDLVSELKSVRLGFDSAVAAMHCQVALLQERRQALITAAVTGQLDIPTVAA